MKIPRNPPDIDALTKDGGYARSILSPEVGEIARTFNERYLHWSEVRYRDTGGVDPDVVWARMRMVRNDTSLTFDLGSFGMSYCPTNRMRMRLHDIDSRISHILDGSGRLRNDITQRIDSMMEESIASSQMEGAVTTTKVAKDMLQRNRKPRDVSEQMILNNYHAMESISRRKDEPLSEGLILDIHRTVTEDTLSESCVGMFRDNDGIVVSDPVNGMVYHTPVEYGRIGSDIDSLCRFVNDDGYPLHPLVKGAMIHFAIGYIHPFEDGNGRVARTLFYWYMSKMGYDIVEYLPISRYIKSHRGRYSDAYVLSETDENDVTYFVDFIMGIVEDAVSALETHLLSMSEGDVKRIQHPGISTRLNEVVSDMTRDGNEITVQYLMHRYGVSKNTARSDIRTLREKGFIVETGKEGHRVRYGTSGTIMMDRTNMPDN